MEIGKHNYEAFLLDYIEGNLDEAGIAALFAFLEQHPELKPSLEEFGIIPTAIVAGTEQLSFEDKLSLKHIPEEIEEKIIAYLEGQLPAREKAEFEQELPRNEFMQQTLAAYRKTYLTPGEERYAAKMQLKRTSLAEETIIAYLEGQLSPAEKAVFEKTLAADEVASYTLNAYKQTRLEADTSLVFPDKESLKRGAKVVRLFEYRKALAIAASVALLFGLFWLLNRNTGDSMKTEGSMALKKFRHQNKKSTGNPGPQKLLASDPALHKSVQQPLHQKQNVIVQPENDHTPQQIANNTVVAPDTSKAKSLPKLNNTPAMEPRSLIVLNPYNETDADSPLNQPTSRPRFGTQGYVAEQINKAAWGEEEDIKAPDEKRKVKGFDVLALIGKGLKKLGNQRSDAKKIEDKEKDYTEYVVTIGSLSVSRKVAN